MLSGLETKPYIPCLGVESINNFKQISYNSETGKQQDDGAQRQDFVKFL